MSINKEIEISPRQIANAIEDLMSERDDLQQRIDKSINILKGLRLIIPIQYKIKEGIDLSLEILGGKE